MILINLNKYELVAAYIGEEFLEGYDSRRILKQYLEPMPLPVLAMKFNWVECQSKVYVVIGLRPFGTPFGVYCGPG